MMKNNGFTLIELLVVISIISMLTSVTLSSLGNARIKGNDVGDIRSLQEVRTAINMYYNDTAGGDGTYPAANSAATLATILVPKYISAVSSDIFYQSLNATNNAVCVSKCPSYHLAIVLSDRNNKILTLDKDLAEYSGAISGKKDTCISSGTDPSPLADLCYDVTP